MQLYCCIALRPLLSEVGTIGIKRPTSEMVTDLCMLVFAKQKHGVSSHEAAAFLSHQTV